MKIVVGSVNPAKIESVQEIFSQYFEKVEVQGLPVSSSVRPQPINKETYEGARNRVEALRRKLFIENKQADFIVGIESGIIEQYGNWFSLNVICIMDTQGRCSFGTSPQFPLPQSILEQIMIGKELATITGEMTGDSNSRQKEGFIGFLTKGKVKRKDLTAMGVMFALIPFLNEKLYFEE